MLFDKKCPSNVIFIFNDMHNGNMKLEHFIDVGEKVYQRTTLWSD